MIMLVPLRYVVLQHLHASGIDFGSPRLGAQFNLDFIGVYDEYILMSVLLSSPDNYPLGVGVRTFSTQFNTQWTLFCAAAVLGSIPIVIIFFLAQRLLVEGLTKGAIKG